MVNAQSPGNFDLPKYDLSNDISGKLAWIGLPLYTHNWMMEMAYNI